MSARVPTELELFWLRQAEGIGAKQSLERLETQGKYLFGLTSTCATLLTGFGLLTGSSLARTPALVLVPVVLIGTSLALAMLGLTPRLVPVDPTDVRSIQEYYGALIPRRARLIRAASVCFALGLATSSLVLLLPAPPPPSNPGISALLTENAGKAKLAVKLDVEGLPPGTLVHLAVTGASLAPRTGEPALVPIATYDGVAGGKPTISLELDRIDGFGTFRIEHEMTSAGSGKLLQRGSLTLLRPSPSPSPTPAPTAAPTPPPKPRRPVVPPPRPTRPCPTPPSAGGAVAPGGSHVPASR